MHAEHREVWWEADGEGGRDKPSVVRTVAMILRLGANGLMMVLSCVLGSNGDEWTVMMHSGSREGEVDANPNLVQLSSARHSWSLPLTLTLTLSLP